MMTAIFSILLSIASIAIVLYAIMILLSVLGWRKLSIEPKTTIQLGVSILVAARNESENITSTLIDLLQQDYPGPLFEVIVIDDHSDDDTLQKCNQLKKQYPQLKVLSAKHGKGKKAALKMGISQSAFSIIATTDADCKISSVWLKTMMEHWQYKATKMLLGPIILAPTQTIFQQVQSMEMLATMGLTGGAAAYQKPIMANGANILFDKTAFEKVGGYENNGNPSGDDVFTMLKMAEKWPSSIQFVKDAGAAILTQPQPTLKAFWQQRKRWLSKKGNYTNKYVTASALITYIANFTGFVAVFICIFNFGSYWADKLLWLLLIKTVLDLILIRAVRKDLQPNCGIWNIIPAQIFILTYVTLIGLVGNTKNYVWKGRSIKVGN